MTEFEERLGESPSPKRSGWWEALRNRSPLRTRSSRERSPEPFNLEPPAGFGYIGDPWDATEEKNSEKRGFTSPLKIRIGFGKKKPAVDATSPRTHTSPRLGFLLSDSGASNASTPGSSARSETHSKWMHGDPSSSSMGSEEEFPSHVPVKGRNPSSKKDGEGKSKSLLKTVRSISPIFRRFNSDPEPKDPAVASKASLGVRAAKAIKNAVKGHSLNEKENRTPRKAENSKVGGDSTPSKFQDSRVTQPVSPSIIGHDVMFSVMREEMFSPLPKRSMNFAHERKPENDHEFSKVKADLEQLKSELTSQEVDPFSETRRGVPNRLNDPNGDVIFDFLHPVGKRSSSPSCGFVQPDSPEVTRELEPTPKDDGLSKGAEGFQPDPSFDAFEDQEDLVGKGCGSPVSHTDKEDGDSQFSFDGTIWSCSSPINPVYLKDVMNSIERILVEQSSPNLLMEKKAYHTNLDNTSPTESDARIPARSDFVEIVKSEPIIEQNPSLAKANEVTEKEMVGEKMPNEEMDDGSKRPGEEAENLPTRDEVKEHEISVQKHEDENGAKEVYGKIQEEVEESGKEKENNGFDSLHPSQQLNQGCLLERLNSGNRDESLSIHEACKEKEKSILDNEAEEAVKDQGEESERLYNITTPSLGTKTKQSTTESSNETMIVDSPECLSYDDSEAINNSEEIDEESKQNHEVEGNFKKGEIVTPKTCSELKTGVFFSEAEVNVEERNVKVTVDTHINEDHNLIPLIHGEYLDKPIASKVVQETDDEDLTSITASIGSLSAIAEQSLRCVHDCAKENYDEVNGHEVYESDVTDVGHVRGSEEDSDDDDCDKIKSPTLDVKNVRSSSEINSSFQDRVQELEEDGYESDLTVEDSENRSHVGAEERDILSTGIVLDDVDHIEADVEDNTSESGNEHSEIDEVENFFENEMIAEVGEGRHQEVKNEAVKNIDLVIENESTSSEGLSKEENSDVSRLSMKSVQMKVGVNDDLTSQVQFVHSLSRPESVEDKRSQLWRWAVMGADGLDMDNEMKKVTEILSIQQRSALTVEDKENSVLCEQINEHGISGTKLMDDHDSSQNKLESKVDIEHFHKADNQVDIFKYSEDKNEESRIDDSKKYKGTVIENCEFEDIDSTNLIEKLGADVEIDGDSVEETNTGMSKENHPLMSNGDTLDMLAHIRDALDWKPHESDSVEDNVNVDVYEVESSVDDLENDIVDNSETNEDDIEDEDKEVDPEESVDEEETLESETEGENMRVGTRELDEMMLKISSEEMGRVEGTRRIDLVEENGADTSDGEIGIDAESDIELVSSVEEIEEQDEIEAESDYEDNAIEVVSRIEEIAEEDEIEIDSGDDVGENEGDSIMIVASDDEGQSHTGDETDENEFESDFSDEEGETEEENEIVVISRDDDAAAADGGVSNEGEIEVDYSDDEGEIEIGSEVDNDDVEAITYDEKDDIEVALSDGEGDTDEGDIEVDFSEEEGEFEVDSEGEDIGEDQRVPIFEKSEKVSNADAPTKISFHRTIDENEIPPKQMFTSGFRVLEKESEELKIQREELHSKREALERSWDKGRSELERAAQMARSLREAVESLTRNHDRRNRMDSSPYIPSQHILSPTSSVSSSSYQNGFPFTSRSKQSAPSLTRKSFGEGNLSPKSQPSSENERLGSILNVSKKKLVQERLEFDVDSNSNHVLTDISDQSETDVWRGENCIKGSSNHSSLGNSKQTDSVDRHHHLFNLLDHTIDECNKTTSLVHGSNRVRSSLRGKLLSDQGEEIRNSNLIFSDEDAEDNYSSSLKFQSDSHRIGLNLNSASKCITNTISKHDYVDDSRRRIKITEFTAMSYPKPSVQNGLSVFEAVAKRLEGLGLKVPEESEWKKQMAERPGWRDVLAQLCEGSTDLPISTTMPTFTAVNQDLHSREGSESEENEDVILSPPHPSSQTTYSSRRFNSVEAECDSSDVMDDTLDLSLRRQVDGGGDEDTEAEPKLNGWDPLSPTRHNVISKQARDRKNVKSQSERGGVEGKENIFLDSHWEGNRVGRGREPRLSVSPPRLPQRRISPQPRRPRTPSPRRAFCGSISLSPLRARARSVNVSAGNE